MDGGSRVLVAGATGYIGRHIVSALHDQGYRVRALARDQARLALVRDACDEVFVGQATRSDTLDGLCNGVDVVVSALGLRTLRSRPTAQEVDLQANLNILERARSAGVRQFILVSVLHGDELSTSVPILQPREEFTRTLKGCGLTWTVLRPTGAFNDLAEIFRFARHGWGLVLGDGQQRVNPIHPADIADAAARAITDTTLHDTEWGFGGPDIYTQRELAELATQVLGKRLRTVRVPYWPLDAAAKALDPVNRNAAGFLRFFRRSLSQDMVGAPVGTHQLAEFYRTLVRRGRRVDR